MGIKAGVYTSGTTIESQIFTVDTQSNTHTHTTHTHAHTITMEYYPQTKLTCPNSTMTDRVSSEYIKSNTQRADRRQAAVVSCWDEGE